MGSNPIWCSVFFSEFPFNDANIYLIVFLLDSLGGWMVASQICLNVTA